MVPLSELEEIVGFVVETVPPFELLVVEVEGFLPTDALMEWPHEICDSLLEFGP